MAGYEYWIDFRYEDRIKTTTQNGDINLVLDVSGLEEGIHFYNFRAKDNKGYWSAPLTQYFFCTSTQPVNNNVTRYEYWIDKAYSARKKVDGNHSVVDLEIDVNTLNDGIHYLNFRAEDKQGNWSSPITQYFYKPELTLTTNNKIIAYEYWCNEAHDSKTKVDISHPVNPFEIRNQLLPVTNLLPTPTPESFEFEVDIEGNAKIYYSGSNQFNIRFLDVTNAWSPVSGSLFADGKGVKVQADSLFSEIPVTKTKPASNEIHFYRLDALKGDSLIWKTDMSCTIQVFDPFGIEIYTASGEDILEWNGVRVKRDGVYHVLLHSATPGGSEITLDYRHIHKYAVLGYDVKKVGNQGISTINFDGNGFETSTGVLLINKNNEKIEVDTIVCKDLGKLSAIINFTDREKGWYDMHVLFRDTTFVFENGIEIEESNPIELSVSVIGPSDFRIGSLVTYTITVKNNGNATAYQVPLNIQIKSEIEEAIENLKLSSNIPRPHLPDSIDLSILSEEDRNAISEYFNGFQDIYHFLHVYNEETKEYIHVSDFFLNEIAPNSTFTITLQFTAFSSVDIEVMIPKIWYPYSHNTEAFWDNNYAMDLRSREDDMACCITKSIECILSVADFLVGNGTVNCVFGTLESTLSFAFGIGCGINGPDDLNEQILGATSSLLSTLLTFITNCAQDLAKGTNKIMSGISTGITCWDAINSVINCTEPYRDKQHSDGVQSYDPNDKIGYRSPSGSTYFNEQVTNMTYVINFENDPEEATAAAQDVYITDTLDMSRFDISSFRAGHIMIGEKMAQAPYDVKEHIWEIDMRPGMDLIARVILTLDEEKGIARWHFASIDPLTDEPTTDVFAGFLPPNDEQGRGQGLVSFTIDLKKDLPDDVEVSNTASIVFDYNEAILTPPWTNRRDIIPPVSSMLEPVVLDDHTLQLQWEGSDHGSGIWKYDVYTRTGETDWHLLYGDTEYTEEEFLYLPDTEYGFYVVATDRAINKENKNPAAEVTFFRSSSGISGKEAGAGYITQHGKQIVIRDCPGFSCDIYDTLGRRVYRKDLLQEEEKIVLEIPGVYLIKVWMERKPVKHKKVMIR